MQTTTADANGDFKSYLLSISTERLTTWKLNPVTNVECFVWNKKWWVGIAPTEPAATECGLEQCLDCGSGAYLLEAVNNGVPEEYQALSMGGTNWKGESIWLDANKTLSLVDGYDRSNENNSNKATVYKVMTPAPEEKTGASSLFATTTVLTAAVLSYL